MAVIHQTTLRPGKLALLSAWLPFQAWYRGGPPALAKCGGFRLDDRAGEVGMEFMLVADASGHVPAAYHVPLTYRGSPLAEADHALVGTTEHGVLGSRWVYDGTQDPVLTAHLLALLQGSAVPQAQNSSDTPDPSVIVHFDGDDITSAARTFSGTDLAAEPGLTVRIVRALRPAEGDGCATTGARGCVTAGWRTPDGTEQRGSLFTVLR
jgi:Maltokinase N-terminal cap domain